jgi:2-iminobutanoate/2-iminopropanoate deaminase
MKEIIATDRAPKAIGPYSQAVKLGNLLFTSGQVPLDPQSGQMVTGDIKAQVRRVMDNLREILEASGTSLDHVLKTTCYLRNMDDFSAMNEVYADYFPKTPPARSCIQAARLPRDCDVEIDAIAVVPPVS